MAGFNVRRELGLVDEKGQELQETKSQGFDVRGELKKKIDPNGIPYGSSVKLADVGINVNSRQWLKPSYIGPLSEQQTYIKKADPTGMYMQGMDPNTFDYNKWYRDNNPEETAASRRTDAYAAWYSDVMRNPEIKKAFDTAYGDRHEADRALENFNMLYTEPREEALALLHKHGIRIDQDEATRGYDTYEDAMRALAPYVYEQLKAISKGEADDQKTAMGTLNEHGDYLTQLMQSIRTEDENYIKRAEDLLNTAQAPGVDPRDYTKGTTPEAEKWRKDIDSLADDADFKRINWNASDDEINNDLAQLYELIVTANPEKVDYDEMASWQWAAEENYRRRMEAEEAEAKYNKYVADMLAEAQQSPNYEKGSRYVDEQMKGQGYGKYEFSLQNMLNAQYSTPEYYNPVKVLSGYFDPENWESQKYKNILQMTDEEKAIYGTLLYDDPTGKKAEEFYKELAPRLNQRTAAAMAEENAAYAQEHPFLAWSSTFPTQLTQAFKTPLAMIGLAAGDPDMAYQFTADSREAQTIRQRVGAIVDEKYGKSVGFTLQAVNSFGDNIIATLAAGGVYGKSATVITKIMVQAIMSSEAMASTIVECQDKGIGGEKAVALVLGSGLAEAISETASIEALLREPTTPFTYILQAFFTEASEEGASAWMERGVQAAILGKENDLNREYQEKVEKYGQEYALDYMCRKVLSEDLTQELAGGLGGLLGGLTGVTVSAANNFGAGVYNRANARMAEAYNARLPQSWQADFTTANGFGYRTKNGTIMLNDVRDRFEAISRTYAEEADNLQGVQQLNEAETKYNTWQNAAQAAAGMKTALDAGGVEIFDETELWNQAEEINRMLPDSQQIDLNNYPSITAAIAALSDRASQLTEHQKAVLDDLKQKYGDVRDRKARNAELRKGLPEKQTETESPTETESTAAVEEPKGKQQKKGGLRKLTGLITNWAQDQVNGEQDRRNDAAIVPGSVEWQQIQAEMDRQTFGNMEHEPEPMMPNRETVQAEKDREYAGTAAEIRAEHDRQLRDNAQPRNAEDSGVRHGKLPEEPNTQTEHPRYEAPEDTSTPLDKAVAQLRKKAEYYSGMAKKAGSGILTDIDEIIRSFTADKPETGVTTKSGTDGTVDGVSVDKDGNVQLSVVGEDGEHTEAVLADVDVNDKNMENLITLSAEYGPAANAVFQGYFASGQTLTEYAAGLRIADLYGRSRMTLEQAIARGEANGVSETVVRTGYYAGRTARAAQETAGARNTARQHENAVRGLTQGTTSNIETVIKATPGITRQRAQAMTAADALIRGLGMNVEWYASGTDENGIRRDENGSYHAGTNTIRLDVFAGNNTADISRVRIYSAMMHELTHAARTWAGSEAWNGYRDFVLEHSRMTDESFEAEVEKRAAKYMKEGKSREDAIDLAEEEIVADASANVELTEDTLREIAAKDMNLFERIVKKIGEMFDRIVELFRRMRDDGEMNADAQRMLDVAEQQRDMWNKMVLEARENMQAARAELARQGSQADPSTAFGEEYTEEQADAVIEDTGSEIKEIETGERRSDRTWNEEDAKPGLSEKKAKQLGINYTKHKARSGGTMIYATGRDVLTAVLRKNGFDPTETIAFMDKVDSWIKNDAVAKFTFVGLEDINNARMILDKNTGKVLLSCMVKNGDYPVNFDFTKICKKRVAFSSFIDELARREGKNGGASMLEEIRLEASDLFKMNEILRDMGYETACLGCFVEARRYSVKNWAETIVNEWNAAVRKRNPNAGYFDFAKGTTDVDHMTPDQIIKIYEEMQQYAKQKKGANSAKLKMPVLAKQPSMAKLLRVSDLITSQGRTNLHKYAPELDSIVASRFGSASPKGVEAFAPYNNEIELLPDTKTVNKKRMSIQKYLKSIAGARSQSFSDFIMTHVFDHLQKTAGLAAIKATAHTYTKEISRAILFGMTGEKINLSVMFEIDPKVSWAKAGLDANGEYIVADYENAAKVEKLTGKKQFTFSIPWARAVEIEHDPRYSKNCGIIGVGYSYFGMLKMLRDDNVPYIIGYHRSEMPTEVMIATNIAMATDYTSVQNTMRVKGYRKVYNASMAESEGVPSYATWAQKQVTKKARATNLTYDLKAALARNGGDGIATMREWLQWMSDNQLTPDVVKAENGHGKFDLYESFDRTRNTRMTASEYIAYCIENDELPLFYEFAGEENYDKILPDFSMRDLATGEFAPQQTVSMQPILNMGADEWLGLCDHYMGQYDQYMHAQYAGDKYEATLGKIYDALKKEDEDAEERYSERSIDDIQAEYEEALKENDEDWQLYMVDRAAYAAGYTTGAWHGSPFTDITEFNTRTDLEKPQKLQLLFGSHFTQNPEYAKLYAKKTKTSKGTSRMSTKDTGRIYNVKLDLGKSLNLRTATFFTPGSEMWNLYQDLPDNIKKRVKPGTFSAYDEETGIGSGQYVMESHIESALEKLGPKAATQFLIDHGYNSVLYTARYFNGMPGTYSKDPSIIMLDPERIKSGDAKTYDKDGKVIPLTERFNRSKKDIRYSERVNDGEYKAAIDRGDMATAQMMVDEAAKEAGYTIKGWHGSVSKERFTRFKPGERGEMWFASTEATSYNNRPNEYSVYLKMENPYEETDYLGSDSKFDPSAVTEKGRSNGHDGGIVHWRLDPGMVNKNIPFINKVSATDKFGDIFMFLPHGEDRAALAKDGETLLDFMKRGRDEDLYQWYVVYKPEQIKSADPVVYDDGGNVIPLSERFNWKRDDIRYSNRVPYRLSDTEVLTQADRIKGENQQENEVLARYRQEQDSVNHLRGEMENVGGQLDSAIATGKGEEYQKLLDEKKRLERKIGRKGAKLNELEAARYQSALEEIEMYKRKIDQNKTAIPVAEKEGRYTEARKMEQQNKALERSIAFAQQTVDAYGGETNDKAQARLDEVNRQIEMMQADPDVKAIDKLRTDLRNLRRAIAGANDRMRAMQKSTALKGVIDRERQRILTNLGVGYGSEAEEYARNINNALERERYRQQAVSVARQLMKMINEGDKKTHIPAQLIGPLKQYLQAIDTTSGRNTNEDKAVMRSMLQMGTVLAQLEQAQAGGEEIGEGITDLAGWLQMPEGYAAQWNKIVQSVVDATNKPGGVLRNMSLEDMRAVAENLTMLRTQINKANAFLAENKYRNATNAAQSTINELRNVRPRGDTNRAANWARSFFAWQNATPYYAFKRMGTAAQAMFRELMDGWDQMDTHVNEIIAFRSTTYNDEEVRSWEKQEESFELESGKKVRMTAAQIMSLYCLNRRAQGQQHLLSGGMRVMPFNKGRVQQNENFLLTKKDIKTITDTLTDRQIEVANALQEYMSTKCAAWGNRVTMSMYGIRFFGEKAYFPIATAESTRSVASVAQERTPSLYKLMNQSFMNRLNEKANAAIQIDDIFDVFTNHSADMAKMDALGPALMDLLKWYGYRESYINPKTGQREDVDVRTALEQAFGRDAGDYIRTLIQDINGTTEAGREYGMMSAIMSRYKVASVGGNLRVVIQQPTSYFRAAAMINTKYLRQALATRLTGQAQKAMELCPIASWKSKGYYDTGIQRSMRSMIKSDATRLDKVNEKLMWLAGKADELTWGRLFTAVELETEDRARRGEITAVKGSEEWNKILNDRFREIVYATQVVDSTLTRSQIMRGKGTANKSLTAFMAEPTLTTNMLMDLVSDVVMDFRKGLSSAEIRRKHMGRIARTGAAVIMSKIAVVLAQSLADAFRDDDDYETFAEKLKAALGKNSLDEAIIFNQIPLVKDIWNAATGGSSADMTGAVFTDLRELGEIYVNTLSGNGSDSRTAWGIIYTTARTIDRAAGTASANVLRDSAAIWNTATRALGINAQLQTYRDKDSKGIDALYAAILSGDEKRIEELQEELKLNGVDIKKVESGINTRATKSFVGDEIDEETATEILGEYAGYSGDKLEDKIAAANYQRETGKKWANKKDDYLAGLITKEDAIKYLQQYGGKTADDAYWMVASWEGRKKYDRLDEALIRGTGVEEAKKELTGHGVKEETVKSSITRGIHDAYDDGTMTGAHAVEMLVMYGGKTREQAENMVKGWRK